MAHQDPKKAGKWARYFREGYDAWGLLDEDHPIWNEKQQEWLESYAGLGLRGFLKAGELLFQSGKYEEGALAIRFLKTRRDELDAASVGKLAKWFEAGIRNWAHTDVLCGELIAPLLESRRIDLAVLAGWRESEFKYQRRAIPVAMLGLLKTRPGHPAAVGFPASAHDGPRARSPPGRRLVSARSVETGSPAGGGISARVEGPCAAADLPVRDREDDAGRARAFPPRQVFVIIP